jgi:hypothetical protein
LGEIDRQAASICGPRPKRRAPFRTISCVHQTAVLERISRASAEDFPILLGLIGGSRAAGTFDGQFLHTSHSGHGSDVSFSFSPLLQVD